MTAAVKKSLVIAASATHCFRVFTDGIDRWWPREHHVGTSPLKKEVLEGKAGGRWYGLSQDGTECDIGRVLSWEPPHRLLLAWQLTSEWKFDPAFETTIEVRFIEEGPQRTRLEFEHRDLHRYGVAADEYRKQIDPGWGALLEAFAKTAGA